MSDHWSREEVEAAVADYFDMLLKELRGESFNKAERNRALQQIIGRNRGSIEFKHQNISGVLVELGYPYVDGYKPLKNYQELLRCVIEDRLAHAVGLNEAAENAVESPVEISPTVQDILSVLVPAPVRDDSRRFLKDATPRIPKVIRRNYLEIESRNRSLGRSGEEFVMRYEHERLWRAGQRSLADKIEHVAETQGDGLGYDILSFEENGRERLIEVKTTRFGSSTPFFATRNEVNVSESRDSDFQLYRIFKFTEQPRLFVLGGSLRNTCDLEPNQFSALPK